MARSRVRRLHIAAGAAALLALVATSRPSGRARDAAVSCFALQELGTADVRRGPSDACARRLTPASTFKVPHALAALDAGVVSNVDETFAYDGAAVAFPSWKRDHSLRTAMRYSVLWYFQRVAEKLGAAREREYLEKLDYGNRDATGRLTSFWIGGPLQISPDEQIRFLGRLYRGELPISGSAMRSVREILVQPPGLVVNAAGEHPLVTPWPAGAVLSAKTGSATDRSGADVRWLVGHVSRGSRSWIFVSCVAGDGVDPLAAIALAGRRLREEHVL
jgi:beta-lactamase class D